MHAFVIIKRRYIYLNLYLTNSKYTTHGRQENVYDSMAFCSSGCRRRFTTSSPLLFRYVLAMSSSAGSPYGSLSGSILTRCLMVLSRLFTEGVFLWTRGSCDFISPKLFITFFSQYGRLIVLLTRVTMCNLCGCSGSPPYLSCSFARSSNTCGGMRLFVNLVRHDVACVRFFVTVEADVRRARYNPAIIRRLACVEVGAT